MYVCGHSRPDLAADRNRSRRPVPARGELGEHGRDALVVAAITEVTE
jgi:hypothetical protein